MIGNQIKGRGFRGLLNYLSEKQKAECIGGNMSGRNARELAAEFSISRQLNPDVERAVYHVSLSLPPHEQLDNDSWNEIAEKYLEFMGFTDNQYVVYRHHDTDHDHIHIAASRIRLNDGSCVHDSWDYLRSEKVIRQLEREYELESVSSSREKLERTASTGQLKRVEREQVEYEKGELDAPPVAPIKVQLQELIDRVTADPLTMPQLINRLQQRGVKVRHGFTRNGVSKGISYGWMSQHFSGTQLGAAYTFPGLQKHRGVEYVPQRDEQLINDAIENPASALVEQHPNYFSGTASITKDGGVDTADKRAVSEKSFKLEDAATLGEEFKEQQRQLAFLILPIVQRAFKYALEHMPQRVVKGEDDTQQMVALQYTVSVKNEPDGSITSCLSTADGRGELIRVESDELVVARQLTGDDLERWREIEEWLGQLEKELKRQKERFQRQKTKSRELEID